jgi:hypothetical protein
MLVRALSPGGRVWITHIYICGRDHPGRVGTPVLRLAVRPDREDRVYRRSRALAVRRSYTYPTCAYSYPCDPAGYAYPHRYWRRTYAYCSCRNPTGINTGRADTYACG